MAGILQTIGRLEEAEALSRENLEMKRRLHDPYHGEVCQAIGFLAGVLQARGRLSESETLYREALENCRKGLGEKHYDTIVTIGNVGAVLHQQGKLIEAEPYYRESLDKLQRLVGNENPQTLIAISELGALLDALGRPSEAVELLAPSEPTARRILSVGDAAPFGRYLLALGRARTSVGDFEAAEADLTEAYATLSETKGATDRDRVDVLGGLVKLYDAWQAAAPERGHEAKAAEWRIKLAEWQAKSDQAEPSAQPSAPPQSDHASSADR